MDRQQPIHADVAAQQIVTDPNASVSERRQLDGGIEHPGVLHEGSDITFRGIGVSVVVIGLALAAVAGAVRLFVQERKASNPDPVRRSAVSPSEVVLPRAPRLEAIEWPAATDDPFAAAQRERETRLHSDGPTDEPGFVHIPIEKAMKTVAKDLQSQTPRAPAGAKSSGLLGGGEANSGRVFREESR